jgi:murein DD-endopeptidase MepM/ murein hydrolase activator NlpD
MMQTTIQFRRSGGERQPRSTLPERLLDGLQLWRTRFCRALPRYAAHLVVALLGLVALSVVSLDLGPALAFLNRPLTFSVIQDPYSSEQLGSSGGAGAAAAITTAPVVEPETGFLWQGRMQTASVSPFQQDPVVHTTIPERERRGVITYQVQNGDSVLDIATRFGLRPETITWANGELESNPDLLRLGQTLLILPIDGVYHTIVAGDTLSRIASTYDAQVEDIVTCPYNDILPDGTLVPGQKLIVPGGTKPYVPRQVTAYHGPIPDDALRGTGIFGWPTSGRITDRFGYKTLSGRWHTGLDIAGSIGTPIYAADAGFVTFTGMTQSGYGKLVIVDHGNGYVTYYAHLSVIYVSMGQSVDKGVLVGAMGSTGNSTGSHLHFEIRHKGVPCDPQVELP